MIYVALLRGINVGGNNKVDMKTLRGTFELAGVKDVRTYINSGNVIFSSSAKDQGKLASKLEKAIEGDFGFHVKVLLRDIDAMRAVAKALSGEWMDDDTMKCDVMFLWDEVDTPEVVDELPVKPGIDDARYVPGAILWAAHLQDAKRSGISKLAGTPLYRLMTIRNRNTARKLLALMEE